MNYQKRPDAATPYLFVVNTLKKVVDETWQLDFLTQRPSYLTY